MNKKEFCGFEVATNEKTCKVGLMDLKSTRKIGFFEVVSIGIGGMVGGGIFAVLGLAVELAYGGTPIAFLLAGLVALITSYSYARLSIQFPSRGGTVEFLNKAFGVNLFTGSLNILLWLSYIIMISLYAYAFGSYGASWLPENWHTAGKYFLMNLVIVAFTVLNIGEAKAVGEAEEWIVGLKIAILLLFIAVGAASVKLGNVAPADWPSTGRLVAGGMIIFLAYEGFELIANTAQDVITPQKILPPAFFTCVLFVILLYVGIAIVAVGNLSVEEIVKARDYALAESAKPFFGKTGFFLITIAALLSTGSAINATLYGMARMSYTIAAEGELPKFLERKIWNRPIEGLLMTTGLSLLVVNLFDLQSISIMGSSGFLIIFGLVNAANVKLHQTTQSYGWLSGLGFLVCFGALGTLCWYSFITHPLKPLVLLGMIVLSVIIEFIYRKFFRKKEIDL